MLCQNLLADLCGFRRRRGNRSAICPHHFPAEWLLFIGNLYHIYPAVQVQIRTCHGQCRSPLTRTSFGGNTLQTLLLGVISLRNGTVELVAAGGVIALKLVIDMCWRTQCFFQAVSTYQRRRTVHLVKILDILGNVKIRCGIVQFLLHQLIAEHMREFFCGHGL